MLASRQNQIRAPPPLDERIKDLEMLCMWTRLVSFQDTLQTEQMNTHNTQGHIAAGVVIGGRLGPPPPPPVPRQSYAGVYATAMPAAHRHQPVRRPAAPAAPYPPPMPARPPVMGQVPYAHEQHQQHNNFYYPYSGGGVGGPGSMPHAGYGHPSHPPPSNTIITMDPQVLEHDIKACLTKMEGVVGKYASPQALFGKLPAHTFLRASCKYQHDFCELALRLARLEREQKDTTDIQNQQAAAKQFDTESVQASRKYGVNRARWFLLSALKIHNLAMKLIETTLVFVEDLKNSPGFMAHKSIMDPTTLQKDWEENKSVIYKLSNDFRKNEPYIFGLLPAQAMSSAAPTDYHLGYLDLALRMARLDLLDNNLSDMVARAKRSRNWAVVEKRQYVRNRKRYIMLHRAVLHSEAISLDASFLKGERSRPTENDNAIAHLDRLPQHEMNPTDLQTNMNNNVQCTRELLHVYIPQPVFDVVPYQNFNQSINSYQRQLLLSQAEALQIQYGFPDGCDTNPTLFPSP